MIIILLIIIALLLLAILGYRQTALFLAVAPIAVVVGFLILGSILK
jgi:hypothetical protein